MCCRALLDDVGGKRCLGRLLEGCDEASGATSEPPAVAAGPVETVVANDDGVTFGAKVILSPPSAGAALRACARTG